MQKMLDFLKWNKQEDSEQIEFVPTIQIHSQSTLLVECTPKDPHTSSNIVLNSYVSKTNRTLLQTRIRWSRFKISADFGQSVEELPSITGNAYRCEPSDLGSYVRAKIISFDVSCSGEAEVTIGPISLDPTIKALVEGALYSKKLRSQIKVVQKNIPREVDMILTEQTIELTDQYSEQKLQMQYDLREPKIELNPKDPTKIFLRFEQDSTNTVRNWVNKIFGEPVIKFNDSSSVRSHSSNSSKLFKGLHCPNKIEIVFLSRHSRDQFLYSLRAFVSRECLKNQIIMQSVENVQQFRSPADAHKFFQFMALKYEILRVASLAKQLQNDRDQKIKDITQLEESISEMTLTYTKIIEQKGRLAHVDFNQSYSQISIRRQEIMGRKQMRQLASENEQLKMRVRELNEQLQLEQIFKKENNDSMLFNQTSNPFLKKNNPGDSLYNPIVNQGSEEPDEAKMPTGNVLEITKSYMHLAKENDRLRREMRTNQANENISRDMADLLESLHDDEDLASVVKTQKLEIQNLQSRIRELQTQINQSQEQAKKMKPRLNQSVAHQQQVSYLQPNAMKSRMGMENSLLSHADEGASFVSMTSLNESMTSQAGIAMLERKLMEIDQTNKKIGAENSRLRKQRNNFRALYQSMVLKEQQMTAKENTPAKQLQFDTSMLSNVDKESFQQLKLQNENLTNENKSLMRKLQSLGKETGKLSADDSMLDKKCESLTKHNNYLRQENESLKIQIETLKNEAKTNDASSKDSLEANKLKKINGQLLEQIKQLKQDIEHRSDPLYNSRVIELENEVNFLKGRGDGPNTFEASTKQLLDEVSRQQKTIEKLKQESRDKDEKLGSQQSLIERLMSQQESERPNSISGKDKSYSETRNESESVDKLKRKIRQLQEEIVLMRRSADALNRSKDISMEMQDYHEERLEMMTKEREALLEENERLSKICEKYAKDAREGVKWKKQAIELMKTQQKDESDFK